MDEEEVETLFEVYPALLHYANERLGMLDWVGPPGDVEDIPLGEIRRLSLVLFERPDLIESFAEENPSGLPPDELDLALSWRHAVVDTFFIVKHLAGHSVFLSDSVPRLAYGVLGLYKGLDEVLPRLPVAVRAVLLPFRERIVYDGILNTFRATFGPGIRRSLEDSYRQAKARYGIVTSLPFSGELRPDVDIERLRALMRSERSRGEHWEEIREMVSRDRSLLLEYHRLAGKVHARHHRRSLREAGATGGWYAVLEGAVVAGATSRGDVEATVEALVPEARRELVHYYRVKRS